MTNENDKLVTIAAYAAIHDAEFAKSQLESEGIKTTIVGENVHGLYPADGMLNVELKVFESDTERAKSILESPDSIEQGEN